MALFATQNEGDKTAAQPDASEQQRRNTTRSAQFALTLYHARALEHGGRSRAARDLTPAHSRRRHAQITGGVPAPAGKCRSATWSSDSP